MALTSWQNAVIGLASLCAGSVLADDQVVRFGGIEVGSGGVKTVVVEMQVSPLSPEAWSVKEDSKATDESGKELSKADRDVFLGLVDQKFSPQTIQNVAGVVKRFKDKHFGEIPKNRQFLVISSGVAAQATDEQLQDLVQQLTTASGMTPEVITVDQEVRKSFDEVLKNASLDARKQALIVDIGSGNTKFGGYVGDRFVTGEVRRGMGSEKPRFEGEDIDVVAKAAELSRDVQSEIVTILGEKFQDLQPKAIYLLGGSFWSMMGHAQPQDLVAHQPGQRSPRLAAVKPESFATYWDWVTSKKDAVTSDAYKQSVSAMLDGLSLSPFARDNALKAATTPFNAIPAAQRPRAAGFLDGVAKAFRLNAPQDGVDVEFVVESHLVWIRGYVQQKALQDPEVRMELLLTEHFRHQLDAVRSEIGKFPPPQVSVNSQEVAKAVSEEIAPRIDQLVQLAVKEAIADGVTDSLKSVVADELKKVKVEVDLGPVTKAVESLHRGLFEGGKLPAMSVQSQLETLKEGIRQLGESSSSGQVNRTHPHGENAPQAEFAPDPQAAWRAFQRGRDEYDHCRFSEALTFFDEAVRHNPKETLYWYFRALTEARIGRTKEAQASAQRVAEHLLTGADYRVLSRSLERVQGPGRAQIEQYIANGMISYNQSPSLRSLTE